jgi:hypothetical protein
MDASMYRSFAACFCALGIVAGLVGCAVRAADNDKPTPITATSAPASNAATPTGATSAPATVPEAPDTSGKDAADDETGESGPAVPDGQRETSVLSDPAAAYEGCFDVAPKSQLNSSVTLIPFDPAFVFMSADKTRSAINVHLKMSDSNESEVIALCYASGDPKSPTIEFEKFAY